MTIELSKEEIIIIQDALGKSFSQYSKDKSMNELAEKILALHKKLMNR